MSKGCVAHRGWSGRAPENTMAAFRLALEASFVEWIELDVQLSKDNVPVVIHDYHLRRTTNGKGEVKEHTAAELARLDAGGWFSPSFAGEPVPLLSDLLAENGGRCKLNIELKTDGLRYPYIEQKVLEQIESYEASDQALITSFHAGTLYRLRRLDRRVKTGLIVDVWRNSLPRELEELEADFLSIAHSALTRERLDALRDCDIQVMAWTVNKERAIRRLVGLAPDLLICTNYPERWQQATAKPGRSERSLRRRDE